MSVVIETSLGDITVDLFTKIKKDYTVRTGDPLDDGGRSIYIHAYGSSGRLFEAEQEPRIKHTQKGCVSMINNGCGKHASQFFITLEKDLDYLDQQGHTVFGIVTEGFEILSIINEQIVDHQGIPFQDICISHTVVLDDPYPDPPYLDAILEDIGSPEVPERLYNSERIGIYETFNDDEGKTEEQLQEEMEKKEAKAKAIVLEMIGDLPDADVKPPENVLFVCRLNPVTEEKDLKQIFSRFGPITSCDIIRDSKTDQSLQYGFIEFENRDDCEKAYFKMDNVLIDDRRIHVDFSQSVARIKWEQYRQMRKAKSKSIARYSAKNQSESKHQNMIRNPATPQIKDPRDRKYNLSDDGRNQKSIADSHSRDDYRDRHSRDDHRDRHSRDDHRDRHSRDDHRDRHSRDDHRDRHSRDDHRDRHSRDDHRDRHSRDDHRDRHSRDDHRDRHSRDDHRDRHSHDDHRDRHSRDNSKHGHSRTGRSSYSNKQRKRSRSRDHSSKASSSKSLR